MKTSTYDEIIREYRKIERNRNVLKLLHEKFRHIPEKTLDCIAYQECQRKTRWSYQKHKTPAHASSYYQQFNTAVQKGDKPGFLLTLSNKINLCPALLARIVLEQYYEVNSDESQNQVSRNKITQMMKDTSLIDDKNLAVEVHLCILADNVYGPITDALRHGVGTHYERKLKEELKEMGLHFIDEHQLRNKGYDKTPDVKLEIPIGIDGHVVNWIESKALFGDKESHKGYLKDQYWSYWNRFGPGLVIYWFGFIDELDVHKEKGILLCDHMPKNIVHMNPEIAMQ